MIPIILYPVDTKNVEVCTLAAGNGSLARRAITAPAELLVLIPTTNERLAPTNNRSVRT